MAEGRSGVDSVPQRVRDSPGIINNLLKSSTTTLTGLSKRMDTVVLVLQVSTSWMKKCTKYTAYERRDSGTNAFQDSIWLTTPGQT